MPGCLSKRSEGGWMTLNDSRISHASCIDLQKKARIKHSRSELHRLECSNLWALYLIPVKSGHPYRSNLASPLAKVQIRRAGHVNTSVSQVYAALRVVGKPRKELASQGDHLMGLLTLL